MPNSIRLRRLSSVLPSQAAVKIERARRVTNAQFSGDIESSKQRCRSLLGFIREAWHVLLPDTPYVHGWHIEEMCIHLEAITRGEFISRGIDNRLLMNVPPGSMKSLSVAVFWAAWEWGPCGMPHIQVITSSFREEACDRDARR